MDSLLSKVSGAVAACARRFMRRLLRGGSACLGRQFVPADGSDGDRQDDGRQGQGSMWRREILMGKRCEPLDFPGAIHYDSFGRRVESPRSGSGRRRAAGALLCRSSDAVDEAVTPAKKSS